MEGNAMLPNDVEKWSWKKIVGTAIILLFPLSGCTSLKNAAENTIKRIDGQINQQPGKTNTETQWEKRPPVKDVPDVLTIPHVDNEKLAKPISRKNDSG
jgi:hypothetical protein